MKLLNFSENSSNLTRYLRLSKLNLESFLGRMEQSCTFLLRCRGQSCILFHLDFMGLQLEQHLDMASLLLVGFLLLLCQSGVAAAENDSNYHQTQQVDETTVVVTSSTATADTACWSC